MSTFLIYSASVFILAAIFVVAMRGLARQKGWLAPVKNDRWHQNPTALFGGVGIFCAFMVSVTILAFWHPEMLTKREYWGLIGGSTISFFLGLFDDIYHFRPATKLIGQISAASLFIFFSGYFHILPFDTINILFTFFWFIGIMNAVNLLDNMDGLASGIVIISASIHLILLSMSGLPLTSVDALLISSFVMSVLGFWIFNRHPATIFMGDSGSLFLGFLLAAFVIPDVAGSFVSLVPSSSLLTLLVPGTILAIPIFDTTLVTVLRKSHGRAVSQGGKDHSSHRLVGLGFSQTASIHVLYLLSLIGGAAAVLMVRFAPFWMFIFGVYVLFLVVIGIYLGKYKVYEQDAAQKLAGGFTPLVSKLFYKKGFVEVALDVILIAFAAYFSDSLTHFLRPLQEIDFSRTVIFLVPITILIFKFSGVYKGVWHLYSIEDVYTCSKAIGMSVGAKFLIDALVIHASPSLLEEIFFGFVLFLLVLGSRISFRFFDALIGLHSLAKRPIKILLYGAGAAGKLVVDEIRRNGVYRDFYPVGFVDDDSQKVGRSIAGIRILGKSESMQELLKNMSVQQIWISTFKISEEQIQELRSRLPQDIVIKKINFGFVPI